MSQRLSERKRKLDARLWRRKSSWELFADRGDQHLSPMRCPPMFKQKNALPRSKLHSAIDNRHGFARAGQHHADMRWHIVAAFGVMGEVIGVLRHESPEKLFQVASCAWVGIFHNHDAATGVLDKNRDCSVSHFALVDLRLHGVGDFIKTFAVGARFQPIVIDAHFQGCYSAWWEGQNLLLRKATAR